MTLRERLADWITGGALTMARKEAVIGTEWQKIAYEAKIKRIEDDFDRANKNYAKTEWRLLVVENALRRIAACETPGANATVRRMAKMAREAGE